MAVVKKGALAPPPLLKKMKIQIYKLIFVVLQILFQNCLNPQVLGDPRLTFEPPTLFLTVSGQGSAIQSTTYYFSMTSLSLNASRTVLLDGKSKQNVFTIRHA